MKRITVIIFFWILGNVIWAADPGFDNPLPILSQDSDRESFRAFAKAGGGYFEVPEHLKGLLSGAMAEACDLDKGDEERVGFYDERKMQIMFQHLERKDWGHFRNDTTKCLAEGMNELAVTILKKTLEALDVPPHLWAQATGGLSDLNGLNHFKLAKYSPKKKGMPGIGWHKDIRWITVIYFDQAGLQARFGDEVIKVSPMKDHFFVNFGIFPEAFINDPERLTALVHRVEEQIGTPRMMVGIFCRGDHPDEVYYRLEDQELVRISKKTIESYEVRDDEDLFLTDAHQTFGPYYQAPQVSQD